MNKILKNETGFGLVEGLLIVVIVGLLVFAGLYVKERRDNSNLHKQLLVQSAAVAKLNGHSSSAITTSINLSTGAVLPGSIKVSKGTTVTWRDGDNSTYTLHTTANAPVQFVSKPLKNGDTFSYTFTQVGTYNYFVEEQPSTMVGTVQVVQ